MPPGQQLQGAKPVSVGLGFDDNLEAERAYAALAEGGQIQMPFGETFWAEGLRHVHRPLRCPMAGQRP